MRAGLFYLYAIFFVWQALLVFPDQTTVRKVFARFGYVKVDLEDRDRGWSKKWPEGIHFVNNFNPRTTFPAMYSLLNSTYPSYSPGSGGCASPPVRRTYSWQGDQLVISVNTSALSQTSSRLVPPISWLSASGGRVRVLSNAPRGLQVTSLSSLSPAVRSGARSSFDLEELRRKAELYSLFKARPSPSSPSSSLSEERVIEISVSRSCAESSLASLQALGFGREDIYRVLDKAPWVLAFDLRGALEKLRGDLLASPLSPALSQQDAVHIISHCPYLLAQYAVYPGRDVSTTIAALLSVGYEGAELSLLLRRFPSLLSAAPERIFSWKALLNSYGVGLRSFPRLLERGPFFYYLDPPPLLEGAAAAWTEEEEEEERAARLGTGEREGDGGEEAKVSARAYVLYQSKGVLEALGAVLGGSDEVDKVVRTDPSLLLLSPVELKRRLFTLLDVVALHSSEREREGGSRGRGRWERRGAWEEAVGEGEEIEGEGKRRRREEREERAKAWEDLIVDDVKDTNLEQLWGRRESVTSLTPLLLTERERREIGGIVLNSPRILSVPASSLQASLSFLQAHGFSSLQIYRLLKLCPLIGGRSVELLGESLSFLSQTCELRERHLPLFVLKAPSVLLQDLSSLKLKTDYLLKSLGGSMQTLHTCPAYLERDFISHIVVRGEYLKKQGKDPLAQGLSFFVQGKVGALVGVAGGNVDSYVEFATLLQKGCVDRQIGGKKGKKKPKVLVLDKEFSL